MKSSFGLALLMLGGLACAGETVMEVIPLHYRPAAEIRPLLAPLLEEGDGVIDNGFSLIVKTSPARLESIQRLIGQLDTRLHDLTISVMQNSHQSAAQLNAEAAIAVSPSSIRMRGMSADTRDVDNRNLNQQLRALEGRPAHIEVGRMRPIETHTVYGSGYGYPIVNSTTQWQQAGSGFAVTARLVGESEVMIDIAPWSDRFQSSGAMTTQDAETSVRARLGEWIEIGGSHEATQTDDHGFNGLNYSTRKDETRILIKVDLAN